MLLSSRQTAILLDTHESSVKRWCNAGELPHSTTDGGHRRIALNDVVAFAARQDIGRDLVSVSEWAEVVIDGVLLLRRGRVSASLRQVVCDWLLDASSSRVSALFRIARSFEVPLSKLYDGLIADVLQSVGDSWAQGAFAVGEEHRVSESLLDVLYGIQASLDVQLSPRAPRVILGTIEGEEHVSGAMMIRTLLSETGHSVCYLGRNVPSEDFLLFQQKHNAPLVCLSATLSRTPEEVIRAVNQILSLPESRTPFRIAVGGSGAAAARSQGTQLTRPDRVRFFDSASDFISWAAPILQSHLVTEHESH
jgi:methanogenic corrinoid protein MtbC1